MTGSSIPLEDYRAFVSGNGFYPNPEATVLQLLGSDRQAFLHNFCTANIKALQPGDSTEAFVLNPKGKTLFFIEILAGEADLKLIIPVAQLPTLLAHLDRYVIVEDVQLQPLEQARVVYASWRFPGAFNSHLCPEAYCGVIEDEPMLQAWRDDEEKVELSREAFEMIRVENRFPISGIDVLDDSLAQEFERDETAISLTKGCYLGQETVARLDALGHTNRSFRIAKCAAEEAPSLSAPLTHEGKVVGRATSLAWSPTHGCYLVLVMVKKPHHRPGSELQLGNQPLSILA